MSKAKNRKLSRTTPDTSMEGCKLSLDKNNNASGSKRAKDFEKYSLRPRSIQVRIETERRQKGEVKEPKPKHKPPPLSKYRRKTANMRERTRMKEINSAYEILQSAVPQYPVLPTNAQGKTCEKLTKITTLRLAMNYIQSLQSLLNQPSPAGGNPPSGIGLGTYDIESDSDSIGNSTVSSSSSCGSSNSVASYSTGPEFSPSPASSYTMSPISSGSTPDCIQTVMRSVVSPAISAAISANAKNLNNVSLSSITNSPGIIAPYHPITTIVTVPSHPHAQLQYRQIPQTVNHHVQTHQFDHLQNANQHSNAIITNSSPNYLTTPAVMPPSSTVWMDQQHSQQKLLSKQPGIQVTTALPINPTSTVAMSNAPPQPQPQPHLMCSPSPQQGIVVNNSKLPPIATTLSKALKKSMSSFLTDCIQLTNGVNVSMNSIISNHNNNGNRTGSLSSLSDLSEYTNDILSMSDEGSVLDEPMFEDIIGTELDLLLDSDHLGFSADLSAM